MQDRYGIFEVQEILDHNQYKVVMLQKFAEVGYYREEFTVALSNFSWDLEYLDGQDKPL